MPTLERHRVAGLDGLRGVAIALVIVFHSAALSLPETGDVGVDLFFVLSGYLITGLLLAEWRDRGRVDLASFWMRRACRLLPVLLLVATTVEFFRLGLGARLSTVAGDWFAQVFYVANWYSVGGHPMHFMSHTWTLAIEEQFYLVWPLLMLVLGFKRRRLVAAVLAGMLMSALARFWLSNPDTFMHLARGTDTRGLALLVGCILAFLPRWRTPWVVPLVAFAGLAVATQLPGEMAYLGVGSFIVLPAAAAAVMWSSQGGLTWRPLTWLGRRSYAIYVIHLPLVMSARIVAGPPWSWSWGVAIGISLVLTLVLAELSWRFVEAPAQAWGRAWSARRSQALLSLRAEGSAA